MGSSTSLLVAIRPFESTYGTWTIQSGLEAGASLASYRFSDLARGDTRLANNGLREFSPGPALAASVELRSPGRLGVEFGIQWSRHVFIGPDQVNLLTYGAWSSWAGVVF